MPLVDPIARAAYKKAWYEKDRDRIQNKAYQAYHDKPEPKRKRSAEYYAKEKVRYKERRALLRAALDGMKVQAGCADCGYRDHPHALDFDHLPGTEKSFDISWGLSRSWKSVLAEIAKCEVVCANCHRIRTFNRRRGDS